jgi:hypothetical protein
MILFAMQLGTVPQWLVKGENMASGLKEPALGGPFISVGDYVMVRCLVTATSNPLASGFGGSGDRLTLQVETPGNIGEAQGVTFICSPIQCRKAGSAEQA